MAKEWAKKFYNSDKWQRCRREYVSKRIMEDGGICENCRELPGVELHHKIFLTPDNISDPDVTLNHENLIWLCKDCHFKVHKEEIFRGFRFKKKTHLTNGGRWFDENGDIHERKVKIVYGSPRSGKTTYVMEHKEESDLVIDLDFLKAALHGSNKRFAEDNLLSLAIELTNHTYNLIECNHDSIDCRTVWIVGGFPKREVREDLADRLKAELIYIESDIKTCISRARELNAYGDVLYSEFVVDNWWRNYER